MLLCIWKDTVVRLSEVQTKLLNATLASRGPSSSNAAL